MTKTPEPMGPAWWQELRREAKGVLTPLPSLTQTLMLIKIWAENCLLPRIYSQVWFKNFFALRSFSGSYKIYGSSPQKNVHTFILTNVSDFTAPWPEGSLSGHLTNSFFELLRSLSWSSVSQSWAIDGFLWKGKKMYLKFQRMACRTQLHRLS